MGFKVKLSTGSETKELIVSDSGVISSPESMSMRMGQAPSLISALQNMFTLMRSNSWVSVEIEEE